MLEELGLTQWIGLAVVLPIAGITLVLAGLHPLAPIWLRPIPLVIAILIFWLWWGMPSGLLKTSAHENPKPDEPEPNK